MTKYYLKLSRHILINYPHLPHFCDGTEICHNSQSCWNHFGPTKMKPNQITFTCSGAFCSFKYIALWLSRQSGSHSESFLQTASIEMEWELAGKKRKNAYSSKCSLSVNEINENKRTPGSEEWHRQNCVFFPSFQKTRAAAKQHWQSNQSFLLIFYSKSSGTNTVSRGSSNREKEKYGCPRFQTCEYINNG